MPFDSLPVTNPVIDALREGRDRIERGWCQQEGARHGRFCTVVALYGDSQPVIDAAKARLGNALGLSVDSAHSFASLSLGHQLINWNDSPDRTQADVLNLYDRAIELAVAEELGRANAAV